MKKITDMSKEEFALYRVEKTRQCLNMLLAKVEPGTDIGYQLESILEVAIRDVEALANHV